MEALCRITLLKPYRGDPEYVIRLGDGQRSLVPMGAISVSDPSSHVGFNDDPQAQAVRGDMPNRWKAAQDIVYDLRLGADNSLIIPIDCAQRWFGDWTVKPGDTSQSRVKRTYSQEKIRVAGVWGDYRRMPRGKVVPGQAAVQPDTRIIGAPDVPFVKIEVLEQNGKAYPIPGIGDFYDPWAFYAWKEDIDRAAVEEAKRIYGVEAAAAPADMATMILEFAKMKAQIEALQSGKQKGA